MRTHLAGVVVAFVLAFVLARLCPAADVRYSGSEGVELNYPDAWLRAGADQKPSKIADVRLALLRFESGTPKADATPAAFTLAELNLESLPEKNRNGAFFAEQTVLATKKADAKSILAEIEETTVGGAKAWYFVSQRGGTGGTVREVHTWVVDAVDRHFMFTAAIGPKDEKALAAARELIDRIKFREGHLQPDGKTVTFSDKNAKVTFDHPSHWHNEPLRGGMVGQWSVYDADGDAAETYLAARERTDNGKADLTETVNNFIAALESQNADVSLDDQQKRTVDGRPGMECVIRFKRKSDDARVTSRVIFVQTPAGCFFLVGTSEIDKEDAVAATFRKIIPNLRLR